MSRPDDTLEQLARLARDDEVLHAASERRPPISSHPDDAPPPSVLPESLTEPISEAQRSSVVDAIQARLASPERVRSTPSFASVARRRRNALVAVVTLTAAAAAVLLALRGSPGADGPLSQYEARVEGAEQTERGSTQAVGVLRLQPSSELRFQLRPKSDERGSVRARAFVDSLAAGGAHETRELEITQEQSAAGALRIRARLPPSLSERGQLLLYVGRPAVVEHALPSDGPASEPGHAQEFRWQFERAP